MWGVFLMNSSDQKSWSTTSSSCNKKVWMASSVCSSWKPTVLYQRDTEQKFIPKEQKREGKEKIQRGLFSEWRVLDVRTGFHTETMARVHPAAFSLLLSLPILRLSLSASEQKHTAHPAQHNTQAKSSLPAPRLFSFTPALFPGRALTAPGLLKQRRGHTNRQANTSPYGYRCPSCPSQSLSYTIMQLSNFQTVHILQKSPGIISALPSCTDLDRQWKRVVFFQCCKGEEGEKEETGFHLSWWIRREWGDYISHDWHPPVPAVLTRMHVMFVL